MFILNILYPTKYARVTVRPFLLAVALSCGVSVPAASAGPFNGNVSYTQCQEYLSTQAHPISTVAIDDARELLLRLQKEYLSHLARAEKIAEEEDSETDPHIPAVSAFNANLWIAPGTVDPKKEKLVNPGNLDLDQSSPPVSFGLNNNRMLEVSPKIAVLQRLNDLVLHFKKSQSPLRRWYTNNEDEFALRFVGRQGLREFVVGMVPGLKSVRNHAVDISESDFVDGEENEEAEEAEEPDAPSVYSFAQPKSFSGVTSQLGATLFAIYAFPLPQNLEHIESYVLQGMQMVFGTDWVPNIQWAATVAALVRAGYQVYKLHRANSTALSLTQAESTFVTELNPSRLAAVPPTPAHAQFIHFMKAVNDVYKGTKRIAEGELIYFGTSYHLFLPNEDEEPEADRHFDLILFKQAGTVKLLVFNRKMD